MKNRRHAQVVTRAGGLVLAFVAVAWPRALSGQQPTEGVFDVALIAPLEAPRTKAMRAALRQAGVRVRPLAPDRAAREDWWSVDVLVVDLPADVALPATSLARWDRPTVFVGGCGARFAAAWGLPLPQQLATTYAKAGPDIHRIVLAGDEAHGCWRQGQLFYLPAEATGAAGKDTQSSVPQDAPSGLGAIVRVAARFRTDRAMTTACGVGEDAAEAERSRRARMHAAAAARGTKPSSLADLGLLVGRINSERAQVEQELADLVPEGPSGEFARASWPWFVAANKRSLYWDGVGERWRVDLLARDLGIKSSDLLGGKRADGAGRDPFALALAKRVTSRHGAAALRDLRTFRCWYGTVCIEWDRVRGLLRLENHAPTPRQQPLSWRMAVLDTAVGELRCFDSPAPPGSFDKKPVERMFQQFLALVVSPLLLMEPSTSLEAVDRDAADGDLALKVRFGMRGFDPRIHYIVRIHATRYDLLSIYEHSSRSTRPRDLLRTVQCGPIKLPQAWRSNMTTWGFEISNTEWNPTLPAGFATSIARLATPPESLQGAKLQGAKRK
ncbi:MAG: hypothetical protein AB8H80_01625 [Planctomycetota bacterium]